MQNFCDNDRWTDIQSNSKFDLCMVPLNALYHANVTLRQINKFKSSSASILNRGLTDVHIFIVSDADVSKEKESPMFEALQWVEDEEKTPLLFNWSGGLDSVHNLKKPLQDGFWIHDI